MPGELGNGPVLCRSERGRGGPKCARRIPSGYAPNPNGIAYSYLTSALQQVAGKTLYLNAATIRGGEIFVELLDEQLRPIRGFSKEDLSAFSGDEVSLAVSWKGGTCPSNENVHTRIYISTGKLYGFAWCS